MNYKTELEKLVAFIEQNAKIAADCNEFYKELMDHLPSIKKKLEVNEAEKVVESNDMYNLLNILCILCRSSIDYDKYPLLKNEFTRLWNKYME